MSDSETIVCWRTDLDILPRRVKRRESSRENPFAIVDQVDKLISWGWRVSHIDSVSISSSWGSACWSSPCWATTSWWPLWVVPSPIRCPSSPLVRVWGHGGITSRCWALSQVPQRIMVFTNWCRRSSRWFTIYYACRLSPCFDGFRTPPRGFCRVLRAPFLSSNLALDSYLILLHTE